MAPRRFAAVRRRDNRARPAPRRGALVAVVRSRAPASCGRCRPRPGPEEAPSPSSIEIHGLRAAPRRGSGRTEAFAPLVAALEGRIPVAHSRLVERDFLRPRLAPLGFGCRDESSTRPCSGGAVHRARRRAIRAGEPSRPSLRASTARAPTAVAPATPTAERCSRVATHLEANGGGTVRAPRDGGWGVRDHRLWPRRSGSAERRSSSRSKSSSAHA